MKVGRGALIFFEIDVLCAYIVLRDVMLKCDGSETAVTGKHVLKKGVEWNV